MAANDSTQPTSSGPVSSVPVATGPATGAVDVLPGALGKPLSPSVPTWVSSALDRAPRPLLRFVLLFWAIISGRRVAGLAAEAAFWVVFSLPWLALALVTGLGYAAQYFGDQTVTQIKDFVENALTHVVTPEAATRYVTPVLEDVFSTDHADLGIIGVLLAVWSGSRAVMTYVDAISIINGEFGRRGYLMKRLISIAFYLVSVFLVIIFLPLVIVGPKDLGTWVDLPSWLVSLGCGLLSIVVAMFLLTSLFRYSAVKRHRWLDALPGAGLAFIAGAIATVGLTFYVRSLFQTNSIYGVLATPVAVMVSAFVLSLVVLAGAAFNAVLSGRQILAATPEGQDPAEEMLLAQILPPEPSDSQSGT